MVPAPADAAERSDARGGQRAVAGARGQSALAPSALLRRTAMDRELGFVESAAGTAVADRGGNPDSDGGAGRPGDGLRDSSHGADGDTAMVIGLRKRVRGIRKNERGVALLAVLLGIALMTLLVVDFAMTAGLGFVSAANQANELRAYYLGRSGVNIGLGLLAEDARADARSETPMDTLLDVWAMPYPTMPLEGGNVSLTVVDETRKLNINGMIDQNGTPNEPAIQRMERLFTILNVDTALIPGIVQWITPNQQNAMGGGGADYYLGLRPPYQPRGGPMPTIADLQLVKGINEPVVNRLRPFLTVMPENQTNINTVSPQVLASLEPELMEDQKIIEA